MMKNKQWLLAWVLALGLTMSAHASAVVTFEDISPNNLMDGHGGISGWALQGGPDISHGVTKELHSKVVLMKIVGSPLLPTEIRSISGFKPAASRESVTAASAIDFERHLLSLYNSFEP